MALPKALIDQLMVGTGFGEGSEQRARDLLLQLAIASSKDIAGYVPKKDTRPVVIGVYEAIKHTPRPLSQYHYGDNERPAIANALNLWKMGFVKGRFVRKVALTSALIAKGFYFYRQVHIENKEESRIYMKREWDSANEEGVSSVYRELKRRLKYQSKPEFGWNKYINKAKSQDKART